MIYEISIMLAILFICIVGIWFAFKYYKKKKKIAEEERNVPKEMLELFNEIEDEMKGGIKEDGTTESPYKILWEFARRNGKKEIADNNRDTIGTEQATDRRELREQSSGQEDIQTRATNITSENKSIVRKSGTNNIKRIISRIRRRNS